MFRRLTEPLPLSEASLLLLRPAMNAPVLNVGYLPVGPARAAVVVFAEEYGGIGIALGMRSSESGQIAVVRNQESIDFDVPLADALEPLLAEAERMGFLFDEDLLEVSAGPKGRSQAMVHWAGLMGGMEGLIPRSPDSDEEPDTLDEDGSVGPLSPSLAVEEMQYPELMLDDVAPFTLAEDDPSAVSDGEATLDADDAEPEDEAALDAALDDPLEDELEDDLDDVLDDSLEDDDFALDDALVGESDLTEPTTPIAPVAAARRHAPAAPIAPPPPAPARVAVVSSTPPPAFTSAPPPGPVSIPIAASPSPPVAAAPATAAAQVPVETPVPGPAPAAAPTPEAPVAPVLPNGILSKFRNAEPAPSPARPKSGPPATGLRPTPAVRSPRRANPEVGTDRSSELARIPIVRVRREREASKRVPFLARLLSSF